MADNVYSSAKILSKNEEVQKYELGNFINSQVEDNVVTNSNVVLDDRQINGRVDPLAGEIEKITNKLNEISQKVANIESDGIKGKDIDAQVVQAIKLKQNNTSNQVANKFGVARSTLLRHIAKQKRAS